MAVAAPYRRLTPWESTVLRAVNDPIRVAIIDAQALVRDALAAFLRTAGGVSIVGEAATPAGLALANSGQPDVVLLRLDPAAENVVSLLQELPALSERSRTLVVTTSGDAAVYTRAVELGAMGVVTCDQPCEVLLKAIRRVNAGELWLDRARTAGVVRRLARGHAEKDYEQMKVESLTPREREIVMLVTEGLANREIAQRLFISEATARNHLTSILDKLELTNRFQLAVYAFRRGLVACPQPPAMLRM